MKTTLIISSVFHVIILLAFQKVFPLDSSGREFQTYMVDLIRPPVEDINTDKISETDIARIKQEKRPTHKDDQATISLDTKDKRYVSYARIIKKEIMHHWRYPPEAMENLLEGSLMIVFSIDREGNMIQIEIKKNSGYKILDREAVKAISTAAPFPPFPEHITARRLNIRANLDYRLKTRR